MTEPHPLYGILMSDEPNHPGLAALEVLLARPAWHRDAACREHPELSWFPGQGADVRTIKDVCAGCLVQGECYRDAVDHDDRNGFWGGVSALTIHKQRHTEAA